MNKFVNGLGAACVMGVWAAVSATGALAIAVNDTMDPNGPAVYFGGEVSGNGSWETREVVGDYDVFAIHSADVVRTSDDLNIRIFTNLAGQVGTSAALGMEYGALFIGSDSSGIDFSNNTTNDTYNADPGRFDYAVEMDYSLVGDSGGTSTAGTVWNLNGFGSDVQQTAAGGTFREEQAWKPYTANANPAPGGSLNATASATMISTWEVVEGDNGPGKNSRAQETAAHNAGDQTGLQQGTGYIDFVIKDFFGIGNPGSSSNEIVFAWGMQCANDIILGVIPQGSFTNPVPLPGSLILLLSGLLGVGWLGRSRARLV